MCGIIGYVGGRPCRELILTGLERLEYRGYDSAGFALLDASDGIAESVRAVGNLSHLRSAAGLNGDATAVYQQMKTKLDLLRVRTTLTEPSSRP